METQKDEGLTTLRESSSRAVSHIIAPLLPPDFFWVLSSSTVATVTALVVGVSWEQQVWVLDLLSGLIRKWSIIRAVEQVL